MQITWHGLNCVRIQGKEVTVILDPYTDKDGPKLPSWKADIVAISSSELNGSKGGKEAFLIEHAGEYEIKGAFVYGREWKREKKEGKSLLYRLNLEDVSIGYLSGLDKIIPTALLDLFEGVDILFVPVGDPEALSVKDAVEVIARIEPRIIIPISIPAKGFKQKLESVETFYKELGKKPEILDKLKVSRKDLPETDQKLYELNLA
jgi:L-ascorbate metabolism protein UlaG (beta-lactamase superfamily)